MTRYVFATASLAVFLSVTTTAASISARDTLEHVRVVNAARDPADITQRARMTITDDHGERGRQLLIFVKHEPGGGTKSVTYFLQPAELTGVGILAWGAAAGTDDAQWIYFPETARVRRIGTEMSRQGMGDSDFSYEDTALLRDLLHDWSSVGTPDEPAQAETVDGTACTRVALKTRRADQNYGRLVLWVHDDATLRKMELFDRDGKLAKVLQVSDVRAVDGVPTPFRLEMTSVAIGSRTRIELLDVRYNRGLDDDRFTQRALQQGPGD